MRALKALLILMGVVIVAGFAFIGWEVYQRATDPDHPRSFARREAAVPAVAVPAGTQQAPATANLPSGSRIGPMLEAGGRVVFHVTLPDGREELHILDPRTGASQRAVGSGPSLSQPGPATP